MSMTEPQRERAPATAGRHLSWHLGVCAWVAMVLIGLDSSQPARAVVEIPTLMHRTQLVAPSTLVNSPIAADRFVKSKEPADDRAPMPVELTVRSGDTLISMLGRVGIVMSDAHAAVRAHQPVFRVREVRPG